MAGDDQDRYGYRHRQEDAYDLGESMPGDVGDSQGTFHDRATQDNNVIVNGKATAYESHKRSSTEAASTSSSSSKKIQENSVRSISQADAVGSVVTITPESSGGVLDTLGRYHNHHVHIEGGTPDQKIRVRLEKGEGYLIGRPVTVRE
jgi:hypothetical protein